ncbi:MAG: aminomethyl-transferring glycine dehydrogenase [Acidobacteria bacterium]|uniref:Glycine dehydrogenase (decarboxylating) n=1 Tax=Candidatus Polarisedimenticola svalbardensis TaxID=2886004 RepID=A0A8J7CFC3_9BACT|nr:aminomethyl-transferring glycine dehydrogenase [Candidatus Polarisedimenticola svalbardensis]
MSTIAKNATLSGADVPFARRHIGPGEAEIDRMLQPLGLESLEGLIEQTVPGSIRMAGDLALGAGRSEQNVLEELRELAGSNQVFRNYIGLGYSECVLPPAIQRGILENPGWYTAYTPYQPEISQGRLEALLNFQTMITDLTALPVSNASLLDEGTAAAEAMTLCSRVRKRGLGGNTFFVSETCHPQTVEVVKARAEPLGIQVQVGDHRTLKHSEEIFGALVQYPDTDGSVHDYRQFCADAHQAHCLVVVAADLLALTVLVPPGEFGADIAVGTTQRFGVPMGFGGPHAAYMAAREEYKRQIPGRLVGLSRDADGNPAVRLALQTREQHIRRDKATSNICTSQVLLAVIASMYAVYHGPTGLRDMALRIRRQTTELARILSDAGHTVQTPTWFDTLRIRPEEGTRDRILDAAAASRLNLRIYEGGDLGVNLAETTSLADLQMLAAVFGSEAGAEDLRAEETIPAPFRRNSEYLTHPVFHLYRSETELMRYMHRLERKDLALNQAMIPLGSCTMKLNAAAEMLPITLPGFAAVHPFAPRSQTAGYDELFRRLSGWLGEITGFPEVCLMPNAGAQGEYAGLGVIRAYHLARGDSSRTVCLIPESAHGTNPASAIMAGMRVVVVKCDGQGNIDVADLKAKAGEHGDNLAALMVTYPSTHGVFEESIREICATIHEHGGQVYMDGANMNAMVGVCRVGELGADVCHLNLHKTFSIPHGGGGPGMGPIGVAAHLAPHLPVHPLVATGGEQGIGPISAAPFGSPSILPISYAYIAMMGADGLKKATQVAILAANYVAKRLEGHYELVYQGRNGRVAHECILDMRPFRSAGISVEDIAKRLMDYGFHAPTMSWPVAGTLMVEPTESESMAELDRFCDAMISIRREVAEVESGTAARENNVLVNAPHTALAVISDSWDRPYPREKAAFPTEAVRRDKFWPAVARVDNAFGDRNLVCSCLPMDAYTSDD